MPQLYRGDISPAEAWEKLSTEDNTYLVDVRTNAELHYVGYPDLNSIHKKPMNLEWRALPDMAKNPEFLTKLKTLIKDHDANIFLLCRTGGRSMEAAIELTKIGYKNCFNIAYGFEGDLDRSSHRGAVSGWKATGLPWKQD